MSTSVTQKKGNTQVQRTRAHNISETPRNQSQGTQNGPSGGCAPKMKFTVKKPRSK